MKTQSAIKAITAGAMRSSLLAIASLLLMQAASIAAPALNLYYDPATGNLKLQNTTSGSLAIQSFSVLTLGNGTVGAATGNSEGYLSTGTASLPGFAFVTSNTSAFGINGLYSEAGGANVGSAGLNLAPHASWSESNPIGPVGSYWDLGNIAVTGMTQVQLDVRFVTYPDSTPPGYSTSLPGKFTFNYEISPSTFGDAVGDVVALAVVPEPSSIAMVSVAGCGAAVGLILRRRRHAG